MRIPTRKLAGPSTSSIHPWGAGSPLSAEPKQASRAATSHSGGAAGSGRKAKPHHRRDAPSQRRSTRAGSPATGKGLPDLPHAGEHPPVREAVEDGAAEKREDTNP